jgi:predicted transcriptional regulator
MAIAPKGLATVAFLKTRMDEGFDHLALFEPLVFDALLNLDKSDFLAEDVVRVISDRTSLIIPIQTMRTLLGRCVKKKLLSREGGRFLRTNSPIPGSNLDAARAKIALKQEVLSDALAMFLESKGLEPISADSALSALAEFISQNKVSLMLREDAASEPTQRATPDRRLPRAIAEFVSERCLRQPDLRDALASMLEGMVLVDVLLRRDIPETAQGFSNLQVYLDTGILFDALGLCGIANGVAANESLTALRQAGARTLTFSKTVEEIRRILNVYQEKLGTVEGRLSLFATALTSHFLQEHTSPSDIKIISSTLEKRLEKAGVPIKEVPQHIPEFTLDEKTLGTALLNDKSRDIDQPRIRHDVDNVAAILTIRRDRNASTIERSVAIFSTSSGRVIKSVREWYEAEGGTGVPPIIHHQAITTLAWLKKPAAAPNVLLHELAATCVAVMRPTRATWEKMTAVLRRLRDQGIINDDETSAIVASELMEPVLASLDDETEPDSDSITEAIDRVRSQYRKEALGEARIAISAAQQASLRKIIEANEQVKMAEQQLAAEREASASARGRSAEIEAKILERCAQASKFLSGSILLSFVFGLVWGLWLTLPGRFDALTASVRTLGFFALGLLAIWTLITAFRGTTLIDIHQWLSGKFANFLVSRFFSAKDEHGVSLRPLR